MEESYLNKKTLERWLGYFYDKEFPKSINPKKIVKVYFDLISPIYNDLKDVRGKIFEPEINRQLFLEQLSANILDNVRVIILREIDDYGKGRNTKFYFEEDTEGNTRIKNYFSHELVSIIRLVSPFMDIAIKFNFNSQAPAQVYKDEWFKEFTDLVIKGMKQNSAANEVLQDKILFNPRPKSFIKRWRTTSYFNELKKSKREN